MWNVYLICALAGGTVFVLQTILSLFGGGDHDYSHHSVGSEVIDHDAHFWGIFGLRAMVAGVTAFGLGGLLAQSMGAPTIVSGPTALLSFLVTAFVVAFLLKSITRLSDDGTAHLEGASGKSGTVYVTIPGDKQGAGKVHLTLQNRTIEVEAVTYGNSLETGTRVIVTSVIGTSMVEVIAAPEVGHEYVAADSIKA